MNGRLAIIAGIVILLLLLLAEGLYKFNRPHRDVSESKAAITITAVEFYGQYEQSETLANAKYINKVIEVTGTIAAIQTSDKSCSILLDAEQPTGAVNCVFSNEGKNRIMSLKKGQKMTVKGKCSGFLMDVNLVDCVMVNNID